MPSLAVTLNVIDMMNSCVKLSLANEPALLWCVVSLQVENDVCMYKLQC